MLSLHIITFPQGYAGALRSNINKTKHQMLIDTSLFNFDTRKGLTVKICTILVCTQQHRLYKSLAPIGFYPGTEPGFSFSFFLFFFYVQSQIAIWSLQRMR